MIKVWVVFRDFGCEGKSEPLAVFAIESLAKIYRQGAIDTFSSMVIKEMEVLSCLFQVSMEKNR